MGQVNKTSLREEFDYLKSEFSRLSSAHQIAPESMVLFKAMFMLFEVMVAVFLEKQTKKDSRNSSKPSSQTAKDESSTKAGTQSKGKEENSQTFSNSRTKESKLLRYLRRRLEGYFLQYS
jgi:transposase